MQFRTRAIHVGNARDPATGAVVRPIHLAAIYVSPGAGKWAVTDSVGMKGCRDEVLLRKRPNDLWLGCRLSGFGDQVSGFRFRVSARIY